MRSQRAGEMETPTIQGMQTVQPATFNTPAEQKYLEPPLQPWVHRGWPRQPIPQDLPYRPQGSYQQASSYRPQGGVEYSNWAPGPTNDTDNPVTRFFKDGVAGAARGGLYEWYRFFTVFRLK